ncbi:flagellar motor protein [Rheinheimera sediminis]|uniref:flagellar motor protein n=1 Tax=Rheinheimera sp. YQF-1 TaxID=2499626 RepID=UPI000FD6EE16|nr:flagellar motor protein [Rheinheimera sp. YQF-1]RVT46935.1 flagellar motor protein [Rheinheimera sp. YQF-1]
MDKLTFAGILIVLVAIVGGFSQEGGDVFTLLHWPAFVIVFGGTLGAVLIQSPASQFRLSISLLPWVIRPPKLDFDATIERMTQWGHSARLQGFLSLEQDALNEKEPLLKRGLNLLVDGTEAKVLQDILDTELHLDKERLLRAAKVFEAMGGYSPTIGIVGAVLGLILALSNISNPDDLGQGIAIAFVATIYGVGLANFVFIPIFNKIRALVEERALFHSMIIEGLCSIALGENPRYVESKLMAYRAA